MPVFTALNGHLPDSVLVYLPWLEASMLRLRADAAASLGRLATAFKRVFGRPLYVSDAYRTFKQQQTLKIQKGSYAATPGTSVHGLGLAVDLASNINVDGSTEHLWMEANGPSFGWINPIWATNWNPADGQHEPWHWEYHPELDTMPRLPAPPAIPAPPATTTTPIWEDDEMISPEGIKQIQDAMHAELNQFNPKFLRSANGRVVMILPVGVRGVGPAAWGDWNNLGHRAVTGLDKINDAAFDRIVASLGGQVN